MSTITTRQRILAVAAELFAAQGIAATPLREIAERLDVTKAALYYHFPSKDHLLAALITPLHDDLGAVLTRIEDGSTRAAPAKVLAHLLDAHLTNHDATRLARDPAMHQVDRLHQRAEQLHTRAIAVLVGGDADPGDRLRAAAALAVLEDVTIRCTPDQHPLARQVAPVAATAALHADTTL